MVWDAHKNIYTNINTMQFVLKLTVALLAASASGAHEEPGERAFLRGGLDEDWDESVRYASPCLFLGCYISSSVFTTLDS